MRVLLVINPISGTGSKQGLEDAVRSRLEPLGVSIDVEHTRCHGDATRLAMEAVSKGYGGVLAAGGDGTVNETAAALRHTGVALGIIPCGSGNGLARHLGIPVDVRASLDLLTKATPTDIDSGTINGHPFFCTCGVGFDAEVSHAFAQKKGRGLVNYVRSALETWTRYQPEYYTLTVDGQMVTERAFLIAICNASQYGNNVYIAPHASIVDGELDVTIIHARDVLTTAVAGIDIIAGMVRRTATIHTLRGRDIIISRTQAGAAHIDGEPVTLDSELRVTCDPLSLRVYANSPDPNIKPIITPATAALENLALAVRKLVSKG